MYSLCTRTTHYIRYIRLYNIIMSFLNVRFCSSIRLYTIIIYVTHFIIIGYCEIICNNVYDKYHRKNNIIPVHTYIMLYLLAIKIKKNKK